MSTADPNHPAVSDTVLLGGRIWPGHGRASVPDWGVAVRDGRVVAVGPDSAIRPLTGPDTRVVELDGRFLLPGFIDSHTHFLTGGFHLSEVDLRGAGSPEEFASRIARHAERLSPGSWITGGGWDHQRWGGELPHRSWIDAATAAHPVFVTRLDLHMGVANSEALRRAGIGRAPVTPSGGAIPVDASGEPTGILKDRAMMAVVDAIPRPDRAQEDAALQAALAHAASFGVTSAHDMGSWDHLGAYERAHASGSLSVRISSYLPISDWERVADRIRSRGLGDDWLRWGGVKGFVDGSLGSATALFSDPYKGAAANRGLRVTDPEELARWVRAADGKDLQIAVHAIGDAANNELLNLYESVIGDRTATDRRLRVEHAQHLHPGDVNRFATLGVIPSVQPYHAIDDGRWAASVIGASRAARTHVFRSLENSGATLAFGSDWTVAPLDPLLGLYAAVTRRTLDGLHPDGWYPDERIGVAGALRAYTFGGAFAGFAERKLGSLKPGKLADLVVLSDDLFALPPERIPEARVELTMVDGRIVFQQG